MSQVYCEQYQGGKVRDVVSCTNEKEPAKTYEDEFYSLIVAIIVILLINIAGFTRQNLFIAAELASGNQIQFVDYYDEGSGRDSFLFEIFGEICFVFIFIAANAGIEAAAGYFSDYEEEL